jgi:hypothetical protein
VIAVYFIFRPVIAKEDVAHFMLPVEVILFGGLFFL